MSWESEPAAQPQRREGEKGGKERHEKEGKGKGEGGAAIKLGGMSGLLEMPAF